MKPAHTVLALSVGLSVSPVLSQLVLPNFLRKWPSVRQVDQTPILGPNIPFMGGQDDGEGPTDGDLVISDVIGKERSINIFAGFTRDIESLSSRFEDKSTNSTILAPSNSAVQKLPRKPWEDPEDYSQLGADAYKGEEGEDRAHRNLRRFVEAHVVAQSPWSEGEKAKTLVGETVWWEERDGKRVIQPGNIEISSTASRVENGEVWVLKGTLNYS